MLKTNVIDIAGVLPYRQLSFPINMKFYKFIIPTKTVVYVVFLNFQMNIPTPENKFQWNNIDHPSY